MRLLILLFIITHLNVWSYGQQTNDPNRIVNQTSKQLNDSAVTSIVHGQSYEKAIALLDKALQIDSNYLMALANKYSYELALHRYDQAIGIAEKMMKIKPQVPNYFVSTGLAYFLSGDSISSQEYFKQAAVIYDKILDTMNKESEEYKFVLQNKAVNLIFSGDAQKGYEILKYLGDKTNDETEKEWYTEFINKSRKVIIDDLVNGRQDTSFATIDSSSSTIEFPQLDYDTMQFYTNMDIKRHPVKNGFYLLKEDFKKFDGVKLQDTGKYYYIAKNVMMPFEDLDTVFKKYDQHQKRYIIEFYFNKTGAKYLQLLTKECINRPLGLLINNKLIRAADILSPIDSGKMDLTGLFTEDGADQIIKEIESRHTRALLFAK